MSAIIWIDKSDPSFIVGTIPDSPYSCSIDYYGDKYEYWIGQMRSIYNQTGEKGVASSLVEAKQKCEDYLIKVGEKDRLKGKITS